VIGIGVLVVAALGILYFHDQAVWVGTDDAVVTGAVIQLGSPTNGVVRSVPLDIGDAVSQGQVVATVSLVSPQNQPQAPITRASVRSTIDGIVVARHASPGDAVTAGRAIVSVVDPTLLWIQAHVDETQVGRIRPGNSAEVTIPALGQVLNGHVVAVGPASTATAAQLSQSASGTSSGRSTQSIPAVPVRIDLDDTDLQPVLGTTATVRVRVQD
jgi:multidrug resistance efflux pump